VLPCHPQAQRVEHSKVVTRYDPPNLDPDLGPNPSPATSLVESLGAVADSMRQLYTDVGLRPYRVFAVKIRWSGPITGAGEPTIDQEEEFLPTPLLDLKPVEEQVKTGGILERGSVTLRQISPRYTSEELDSLLATEERNVECFVEVRLDSRDSAEPILRRFARIQAPVYDAEAFEWTMRIAKQDVNRGRDGSPFVPKMRGGS